MTTYERIIRYMKEQGKITMLDGHKIGVSAITQRCNDLRRNPERFEKYLKGWRIHMVERGTVAEYYLENKPLA